MMATTAISGSSPTRSSQPDRMAGTGTAPVDDGLDPAGGQVAEGDHGDPADDHDQGRGDAGAAA